MLTFFDKNQNLDNICFVRGIIWTYWISNFFELPCKSNLLQGMATAILTL